MYLSKLEIFGFKSFADKITVDFDAGITAIVGPNGCGKTNIVDAVRWVIGEQKASVLRSSTMENVIFNGTKSRKALGYAEVSLTIQNSKGILPSEYSEIKITRRCFRDGTSNYLLNGVSCRLKDITALFMDTGMGADAYSVIELKMVNEILSHRTHDRRKLFEEAAGITKYKERRREALNKLESARESINEANIEIRNRQRTVNALERLAERQNEARELSEKLKILEIEFHTRLYSRLIDETKHLEESLRNKESELEEIQSRLFANDTVIEKYKNELAEIEQELNSSRNLLNAETLKINNVKNTISIKQQRITHLQDNIARFMREKNDIENEINRLNERKRVINEKIALLANTVELMEESQTSKKSKLDEFESEVKKSKDELKDLASKHADSQKHVNEKRNEYELLKSKLELQLERCSKLTEENIANINKISGLNEELRIVTESLSTCKNKLTRLSEEHDEKKKLKNSLGSEISLLEKELINRQHETDKLRNKLDFLSNLFENHEDYTEGIRHLLSLKKENDFSLIVDKLEVEDKFKVAIETALGEISSYLIVDNAETADKYIRLLEDSEKGKITFIIRDRIYSSMLNWFQSEFDDILSHEGVYGWADRFISCPDEYMLIYKYLLDEFIIVEDIETAKKLCYGNFIKFVTLDGDIVTESFVRAGGKTNKETIRLGRENTIEEIRNRISELEEQNYKDETRLTDLRNKYNEVETESLEEQIRNIETEILNHENRIQQINYIKSEITKLTDSNKTEIDGLTESNKKLSAAIDVLIAELEEAENNRYQRERELEHFTSELENLTEELSNRKNELNSFIIEVTKIRSELSSLENELLSIDENIQTRENTIMQKTRECNEYSNEIETLTTEIGAVNQDGSATGHMAELIELENSEKSLESDYEFVKNRYDTKRNLIETLENEQRKLRTAKDEIINTIHRTDKQLTKDRMELHEHKNRIKDEYDVDISYKTFEDNEIFDFNSAKSDIERYRNRLRQLGGSGQGELGYYEEEKAALEKLITEREDLLQAEKDLIKLIDDLNKTAQEKFTETFERIRKNFIAIFRELFMEGDESDLKLVIDPENPDPLDAKIEIIAKPRGKRPQLIDLLSGGEKTLTAIALLFAIYQEKPSPFCILDEVDAPLDDANIDRFIKIIRKFAEDTQFIIVTHNKRTMEAADSMYGVTMPEQGVSTVVNVKFSDQKIAS